MRRFVLDVRNNGGGLFPAGIEVARQWLARGDIVLIADSQVSFVFETWNDRKSCMHPCMHARSMQR